MKIVRESLNEVRYINTKYSSVESESPLKDTETIRVYHGFNKFDDVITVLTKGLSGKERAKRLYSFEAGNNPYGLFVSTDLESIKRGGFAHSGVIIEFTTKVTDLEAPVWVGGRSYFVQGEFTQSFNNAEEREEQRLKNREREKTNPLKPVAASDRPELAQTIFDNPEHQALYTGDLNPNMIKYVWYNEKLHKDRKINGTWKRYSRKDFIKLMDIDTKRDKYQIFQPNDEFDIDTLKVSLDKLGYSFKDFVEYYIINYDEYTLKECGFWPKQLNKIKELNKQNYFNQFI